MSELCAPYCWEPKQCPDHGHTMQPRGRSAPLSAHVCCDNYQKFEINPRHLWSVHDSARVYSDPDGWTNHVRSCEECGEGLSGSYES